MRIAARVLLSVNRSVRITLVASAASSAILWGLAAGSLWMHPREGEPGLIGTAAGTATILTAVIWLTLALRDRDKDLLLKSMADDLSRRAGKAPTLPLRRVV